MKYIAIILMLMGCQLVKEAPVGITPAPTEIEKPEPSLDEFGVMALEVCKAKLSEARRIILARQIVRVAQDTFVERRQMEAFFGLICAESAYDGSSKSPVGAVGLTQVMPQYATEFAEDCGYGKIDQQDLHDSETNLRIGACVFKALLVKFNGNVALAQSAYNSGAASHTTKSLSRLGAGNPETTGYIARQAVFQEMIRMRMADER